MPAIKDQESIDVVLKSGDMVTIEANGGVMARFDFDGDKIAFSGQRSFGPLKTFGPATISSEYGGFNYFIEHAKDTADGVVPLNKGQVVVSNTLVTKYSHVFLTSQSDGGEPGFLRITARTPSVGFTIASSSLKDKSVVAYMIVEPA